MRGVSTGVGAVEAGARVMRSRRDHRLRLKPSQTVAGGATSHQRSAARKLRPRRCDGDAADTTGWHHRMRRRHRACTCRHEPTEAMDRPPTGIGRGSAGSAPLTYRLFADEVPSAHRGCFGQDDLPHARHRRFHCAGRRGHADEVGWRHGSVGQCVGRRRGFSPVRRLPASGTVVFELEAAPGSRAVPCRGT